ncbi:MAG: DUF3288 family protein [Microcoleaceae cyanobacterium]
MTQEQKHPQYQNDRVIVNQLLNGERTNFNLLELARLKIRYRGFPGAQDIQDDLEKTLQRWHLTEETLFATTREIYAACQLDRSRNAEQEDWL